jgi:iron complex outermembrane recepter protein
LLENTSLTYDVVDDNNVVITSGDSSVRHGRTTTSQVERATEEGKNHSSDTFRLAQAPSGSAQSAAALSSTPSASTSVTLQEIVVTAQKREERLQDLPVPVTAINADKLVESNQLRFQDYFSTVPGLNVSPMGLHSVQTLSMRGITTGSFGNSPVAGVTFDDVPFWSSTSVGGGIVAPDLDPSDLARIEVSRGPQGTLPVGHVCARVSLLWGDPV